MGEEAEAEAKEGEEGEATPLGSALAAKAAERRREDRASEGEVGVEGTVTSTAELPLPR